jgi:hypothetical protein
MEYYSILNSSNKKVLGINEPYKQIIQTINVNDPTHIGKHFLGCINDIPKIPILELKSQAKILDLMISPSTIGFTNKLIVSNKLKNIFENKNPIDYQFFSLKINQNNKEVEGYWLMHPTKEDLDIIDFNNSDIYISNAVKSIDKIDIKSVLHFQQLRKELQTNGYKGRSIALLFIEKFNVLSECKKSILNINHLRDYGPFLVSEELKSEIEKEKCTGIEFMPLEVSFSAWSSPGGYRKRNYGY